MDEILNPILLSSRKEVLSMNLKNIKRNSLDYILTDILPVEISELYTNNFFYEYLNKKTNYIEIMINKIIKAKNNTNGKTVLFKGEHWTSLPLKYSISKTDNSDRNLNILQPIACLEISLFIESYEKEILNLLDKGSVYSLRYHNKNNNLNYKSRGKNITKYFEDVARNGNIEQMGLYFKLSPFSSITEFTKSEKWFTLNIKYKYFARIDYKSCFDSIYTHTFKWLIAKDVNDTIGFNNTNIFTTIDRIFQNINAKTSNGIVIGPEFSRMMAEILLQGIDMTVFNVLLNDGIKKDEEYSIYRYVDDIFIFANSDEILNIIIKKYEEISRKYLLCMNESKIIKEKLPFVLESWIKETSDYVTQLSHIMFYTKKEFIDDTRYKIIEDIYLFKSSVFLINIPMLMRKFNDLICMYSQKKKTVVAYTLGTILNKIQNTRGDMKLFGEGIKDKEIYYFLDYIFYIYSFYPDFSITQRLISIISYVNDEIDLEETKNYLMQKIINKYTLIFEKSNINDIINLILLCTLLKIEIPYAQEKKLVNKIRNEDNPVLWANYMLYSMYDKDYNKEILDEIEKNIIDKIDSILCKQNILIYREFWWILIFNKCPYISCKTQMYIDEIIMDNWKDLDIDMKSLNADKIAYYLFGEYLKHESKQFFEWKIEDKKLLKEMTYKTFRRTLFRNYNGKSRLLEFASLD